MRYIRLALGWLLERLSPPSSEGRGLEQLTLYQYRACPYCAKVRRALKRFGLRIDTVDIDQQPEQRKRLRVEGGKLQVPCLRIDGHGSARWLYESNQIIAFLAEYRIDES